MAMSDAVSRKQQYSAYPPSWKPVKPITRSPGAKRLTALPTCSTSPAISMPMIRKRFRGRISPMTSRP
jgi:hypothetical protein